MGQVPKISKELSIATLHDPKLANLARSKNIKVLLAFAQGVAADAYVALVSHWDDLYINFVEKFNDEGSTYDQVIAKEVENYVDESQREWVLKVPKDIGNVQLYFIL